MTDFDWTHYFQKPKRKPKPQVRIALKTLFDAPPEKKPEKKPEQEAAPEPEKKPEKPKAVSIFQAPPGKPKTEKPAEPAQEAPKAKPATPGDDEKELWDAFLKETFGPQGGKELISNTNPKTKKQYPKVQVNTLLKSDEVFHTKTLKAYEAWKAKKKEEPAAEAPKTKPEAPAASHPPMYHSLSDLPDDEWHSIISVIETQASEFDGSVHSLLKDISEIKEKLGDKAEHMDVVQETLTALAKEMAAKLNAYPNLLDLHDKIQVVQDYLAKHQKDKNKDKEWEAPPGTPLSNLDDLESGSVVTWTSPTGDAAVLVVEGWDPKKKQTHLRAMDPHTGHPLGDVFEMSKGTTDALKGGGHLLALLSEDEIPGPIKDFLKHHETPPALQEQPPKKPKKKPKKKVQMESPEHPSQMQVGDIVTWTSGKKKYRGVVTEAGSSGFKVSKLKANGEKWGKAVFFNKSKMGDVELQRYPEEHVPKKFQELDEVKQKAESPKKKTPEGLELHPPPPEGSKHVKSPHDVQTGDAVTWEKDGQQVMGRVVDKQKGKFWVRAIDPKTGKAGDLWVLGQWDLDHLGVGQMSDSDLPDKFDLPKVPPQPEEPVHPPAPDKPLPPVGISKVSGVPVSGMDDIKVGDYVTYKTKSGSLHVAEVLKLEDGKWHVQVINPQTGKLQEGKIRTFYVTDGVNKFTQRDTHRLDPDELAKFKTQWEDYEKAVSEWQPKYEKWEQEKEKVQSAHAEKMKAWRQEKNKIEGKLSAAKHPIEKQGAYNLQLSEDHGWDTSHDVVREADEMVPELAEKYGEWLNSEGFNTYVQKQLKAFDPKTRPYNPGMSKPQEVSEKLWDSRSQGERELIVAARKLGQKFLDDVLTTGERHALESALGGWRGSAKSTGAKRIRGILDEFVPFNKQVSDSSAIHDTNLKNALIKAMAWTQMLFDHFGVDSIRVYRGTKGYKKGKTGPTYFDDLEQGDLVPKEMKVRSATGFSTNPYVALKFGPHTIATRVPAAQIALGPLTDPDMISGYDEDEWIVFGPQMLERQYQGDSSEFSEWDFDLMHKVARRRAS